MKLRRDSYEWALKHLIEEGDSDLFPAPFEIEVIKHCWARCLIDLETLSIEDHNWNPGRRFVIPKEALAFRTATQLDPFDSLILTALIYEIGPAIEAHRIPTKDDVVFSCRFEPTADGRLYGESSNWDAFWEASITKASSKEIACVVIADVTDFYNQIYHHVVENELEAANILKDARKSLKRMMGALTQKVSRGIPVGPHAARLLAEIAMNPVDRRLVLQDRPFCRYVDDVHIFCKSREDAEFAIYEFAGILDQQQRLTLHKQKTKIMEVEEFRAAAKARLVDSPLNDDEEKILDIIRKHSGGDPYAPVSLKDLTDEELEALNSEIIEPLLELYLNQELINYPRLGWLIRRLSQVGTPSALEFVLSNIGKLTPVLGDVARYVIRAGRYYKGALPLVGERIIDALHAGIVARNEYLQLVLINLFARLPELNHISQLTLLYDRSAPAIRREIVGAAAAAEERYWIKERKQEFANADPWLRRAIIGGSRCLPGDEGRIWRQHIKPTLTKEEQFVVAWTER